MTGIWNTNQGFGPATKTQYTHTSYNKIAHFIVVLKPRVDWKYCDKEFLTFFQSKLIPSVKNTNNK